MTQRRRTTFRSDPPLALPHSLLNEGWWLEEPRPAAPAIDAAPISRDINLHPAEAIPCPCPFPQHPVL